MNFYIGQRVVCIDVSKGFRNMLGEFSDDRKLVKDAIYTVRWVGVNCEGDPAIRLQEINYRRSPRGKRASNEGDAPYGSWRFRPLDERKTDISIFTGILDNVRSKEPAM